jgi:hypothetical protein
MAHRHHLPIAYRLFNLDLFVMKSKIISYFKDLLSTLKQIEKHLAKIASAVSADPTARGYPSIRTGKNQYDA